MEPSPLAGEGGGGGGQAARPLRPPPRGNSPCPRPGTARRSPRACSRTSPSRDRDARPTRRDRTGPAAKPKEAAKPEAPPAKKKQREQPKGPAPAATSAEKIKALKGFKVELLYTVPREEQGSWVT